MTDKCNKKLRLPAILLIVSFFCNTIFQIYWGVIGEIVWQDSWIVSVILTGIGAVAVAVYCLKSHLKDSKKIYLAGFGAFALVNVYYCITDMKYGNLPIYTIHDFLYLVICLYMIYAKIRINEQSSKNGNIVFAINVLAKIILIIGDGEWYLQFYFSSLLEFVAFWIIWRTEFDLRENAVPVGNSEIFENDLIKLKELYEMGRISEREYSEMKAKILKKL